jgi:hypothetical protein
MDPRVSFLDFLTPVVVFGLLVLPFIISMLTRHQRQMAELLARPVPTEALTDEVRAIHAELRELRSKVDALSIAASAPALADSFGREAMRGLGVGTEP